MFDYVTVHETAKLWDIITASLEIVQGKPH